MMSNRRGFLATTTGGALLCASGSVAASAHQHPATGLDVQSVIIR
jgi:hypothetical protein